MQLLPLLALLPSAPIAVEPRGPFWVAVSVPSKDFAGGSLSDLIASADRAIRDVTDLRGELVPEAIVVDCSQRSHAIGCVAGRVRSEGRSRFLLMISTFDEARITAVLADLDRVDDAADDRAIAERIVAGVGLPVRVDDPGALQLHLQAFLAKHADLFERAGVSGRLGAFELEPSVPASVLIDGKRIGRAEGKTRVVDIGRGPHVVRLEEDGYEGIELFVDVDPREVRSVSASLRSTEYDGVRQATLYGGIATVAAGAGLTVAGFFLPTRTCIGDEDCPTSFRHALIPVGYSVAAMGAAWALGALLGDPESFPWIELVAGIGIFGVSLGLSLGLDGRCTGSCTDLTGS